MEKKLYIWSITKQNRSSDMDKTIAFKIDDDLIQAILNRCKRDRISKSGLIRMVLGQELASELNAIEAAKVEVSKWAKTYLLRYWIIW